MNLLEESSEQQNNPFTLDLQVNKNFLNIGFFILIYQINRLSKLVGGIFKPLQLLNFQKSRKLVKLFYERANTLLMLNYQEEALEQYNIAILKNNKLPDYYFNKAITLSKMNRLEEALNYYDIVISLLPLDSKSYINKGDDQIL
ncbi:unnamed protein product [Paramecium sonneborni]|uniref:Uncharacterized protein n=1 Tax=Paramecium sonneborni TaxID=65129 RepID=A0A8S1NYJ1_9CILI|nr:unnamed protein product [Paramecium sonneborni]